MKATPIRPAYIHIMSREWFELMTKLIEDREKKDNAKRARRAKKRQATTQGEV